MFVWKGSRICHPNMPLWHKDYLELVISEKLHKEKLWNLSESDMDFSNNLPQIGVSTSRSTADLKIKSGFTEVFTERLGSAYTVWCRISSRKTKSSVLKLQCDSFDFRKATAIQILDCFGRVLQVCNRKTPFLTYIPLWGTSSSMSGNLSYSLLDLLDLEHCLIHSRCIRSICWIKLREEMHKWIDE